MGVKKLARLVFFPADSDACASHNPPRPSPPQVPVGGLRLGHRSRSAESRRHSPLRWPWPRFSSARRCRRERSHARWWVTPRYEHRCHATTAAISSAATATFKNTTTTTTTTTNNNNNNNTDLADDYSAYGEYARVVVQGLREVGEGRGVRIELGRG